MVISFISGERFSELHFNAMSSNCLCKKEGGSRKVSNLKNNNPAGVSEPHHSKFSGGTPCKESDPWIPC
ncbi:hypothetical protein F8388_018465 [Cannabis sativa]|uniref:Uncharacterized protein n=1 Tax=Cannabis sativa TaxID=3483 RepID=A0A7J6EGG4_CANSA|nr:hypothetical protein G4B88_025630 [Cannabis sativa]KAF4364789.1 hypothetical protein F8388_018465 [Cannabis sativa]